MGWENISIGRDVPQEAVDAYPSRCSNCGHAASKFFIPKDYHEQPESERDPGICTVCSEPFGKDDPYEDVLDITEASMITQDILTEEVFTEFGRDEVDFKSVPEPYKIDGDEDAEIEKTNSILVIPSSPDSVNVHDLLDLLTQDTVENIAAEIGARIELFEEDGEEGVLYKFRLEELAEMLPDEAYMSEEELRRR